MPETPINGPPARTRKNKTLVRRRICGERSARKREMRAALHSCKSRTLTALCRSMCRIEQGPRSAVRTDHNFADRSNSVVSSHQSGNTLSSSCYRFLPLCPRCMPRINIQNLAQRRKKNESQCRLSAFNHALTRELKKISLSSRTIACVGFSVANDCSM